MKLFFRILALPFIAVVVLITTLRNYFVFLWLWLRNGGVLYVHDDVFNPMSARDLYLKMDEMIKTIDSQAK